MNFITATFIAFLALCFCTYWLLPSRIWQNRLLVVAGYIFYGWWDWRFCGLLLFTSVFDYVMARQMQASTVPAIRKRWLVMSLVSNLGVLGFFKYYNFFQESLMILLGSLGVQAHPWTLKIMLPVGISFYTFQSMSYTLDVYRNQLRPARTLTDLLACLSFFPQLVAGPIERAKHLLPQFEAERTFDLEKAKDGCRQILWGFAKKMILADNLAPMVDAVYADPEPIKGIGLFVATVLFAFQIYCDFSAYSDIAIGTGRLFGIEICANFRYPYFSRNPGEFWRRWHISLSTWFRDYVYIPLGGNRKGPRRHAINLLITFFLSGLWHGANWTFIIWGIYHGILVVLSGFLPENRKRGTPPETPEPEARKSPLAAFFDGAVSVASVGITFCLICIGWIFFRAKDIHQAWQILTSIFTRPFSTVPFSQLQVPVGPDPLLNREKILVVILILVIAEWLQRKKAHPLQIENFPVVLRWVIYVILIWTSLFYYSKVSTGFIYFQF